MAALTQARTLTYKGKEFYARTHKNVVDGLSNATSTESGLMSAADKTKLDSLQQVNPQTNTVQYHNATTSTDGLMSASDKAKLDGLQNTTAPTYATATASSNGLMSSVDKTKLDSLHAYSNATASSAGLMSAEDKKKLDGLDTDSMPYDYMGSSYGDDSDSSIATEPIKSNTNVWPDTSQKVALSKKVSECRTGIVLVWRLDTSDDFYHYTHIPKYHVQAHSSAKIADLIPTTASTSCIKVVYVTDNEVYGTSDNYKNEARKIRLHEILEY